MPRKILLSFPVQNTIKFLGMQMTSDMLLRKSSLASFPANLTLCCPAITPTDHHHHHHLNSLFLHISTPSDPILKMAIFISLIELATISKYI